MRCCARCARQVFDADLALARACVLAPLVIMLFDSRLTNGVAHAEIDLSQPVSEITVTSDPVSS